MAPKNATTTQENKPWSAQEGYYKDLYSKAQSAFDQTNGQVYGGQTYAGPTQAQQDAISGVKTASAGMGTGVEALRNLATSQLNGDWLNPSTNPYIANVAQAALNPVQQAFDKNKLAVQDRAIMSGAYGGARQDLQENDLVDQFSKTAGDITNSLYFNNYNAERGRQQTSGNLLDQANQLSLAGPTALAGAGQVEQGWNQAALDAELKKWQMEQQAPWSGMSELASILGSGGFGTSVQENQQASNPLLGILQGAMGGASTGAGLATGIGGVAAGAGLSAFAPWMLPFAALGGLSGAL